MKVNPNIFKAYDIRGVYPDELTEDIAYKVGQSFANFINSSPILVGADTRVSSPALKKSLIEGIINQGVDVIDIDLCSSPCFYFTAGEPGSKAGIMLTASHASKEFNGFKMVFENNVPLTKEHIFEMKDLVMNKNFEDAEKKGTVTEKDPTDRYLEVIKSTLKEKIKPLKVVMDAGNGMAGLYIEKVFSDIGIDLVPLYTELDGNFPNHETNPKIPENRQKLKEKILEEKADLGFMFDGDGDRFAALDRNGDLVDYSLLMALMSEYMVNNSDKKEIVIEVRTSRVVRDWVEKAGGKVITSTCWTIPIKFEMQKNRNIVFGGETSGHYVFPILHDADGGILAALTFLQAISAKEESIDEIIEDFRKTYFVLDEINFEMESKEKAQEVLDGLKEKYSSDGAEFLEIDGLSVIFTDWWFNLRESQSEPLIRLNLEANSKELFEEKKEEIINFINSQK